MPEIYIAANGELAFTEHQITVARIKPIKGKPLDKDHPVRELLSECSTVIFAKEAFIILFRFIYTKELTIYQLFEQLKHDSDENIQKLALILHYYTEFFYDGALKDERTVELIAKHCPEAFIRPASEIVIFELGLTYFPKHVEFKYDISRNRFSRQLTPELAAYYITQEISYYTQQLDSSSFAAFWKERSKCYHELLLRVKILTSKWNIAKDPTRAVIFVLDMLKYLRELNNFPAVAAMLAAIHESADDGAFEDFIDIVMQDTDSLKLSVEGVSVEVVCDAQIHPRYEHYISDMYNSIGIETGREEPEKTYLFDRLQQDAKYSLEQVYGNKKARLMYLNAMLRECMPVYYDLDVIKVSMEGSDEEIAICNYLLEQMSGRRINYMVDDFIGSELFTLFD